MAGKIDARYGRFAADADVDRHKLDVVIFIGFADGIVTVNLHYKEVFTIGAFGGQCYGDVVAADCPGRKRGNRETMQNHVAAVGHIVLAEKDINLEGGGVGITDVDDIGKEIYRLAPVERSDAVRAEFMALQLDVSGWWLTAGDDVHSNRPCVVIFIDLVDGICRIDLHDQVIITVLKYPLERQVDGKVILGEIAARQGGDRKCMEDGIARIGDVVLA